MASVCGRWTSTDTDSSLGTPGTLYVSYVRGGSNTGARNVSIDDCVLDAGAVVGKQTHPKVGHLPHWSKLFAIAPERDRSRYGHITGCVLSNTKHQFDHTRRINGRNGVGHGHNCAISP